MPLTITIPAAEYWDQLTEEFIGVEKTTITLEHSLASVSKWESKWKKSFLSADELSEEEFGNYVKCMTLEQDLPDIVYRGLTRSNLMKIEDYMKDSMTATWFKDKEGTSKKGPVGKIITAEIIYYYMVELGIPFECQYWHLNKLLALIHVCSEKNTPGRKMSKREVLSQYASVNAARRAKLGTKG